MAGRTTERKGKTKDTKSTVDPVEFASFTLPDSLPTVEVPDYPALITRKASTNWNTILEESRQFQDEIDEYVQRKQEPVLKKPLGENGRKHLDIYTFGHTKEFWAKLKQRHLARPVSKNLFRYVGYFGVGGYYLIPTVKLIVQILPSMSPRLRGAGAPGRGDYGLLVMPPREGKHVSNTESDYIKKEVFGCLIPAIEETLNKAKIWDVFCREKCFFNGIDWIVQFLWNNNPLHPERAHSPQHLYNMAWVRKILEKDAFGDKRCAELGGVEISELPRPYFPKSWLWTEDYAATMIQKTVRQYFVQREEDVQEMRDFWRKVKMERNIPEIDMNPLLARKFASTRSVRAKK